tara:strand:- start:1483 stop:1809 length:327 start_codon:yes stop_codon:yes gene_type:complete
VNVTYTLIGGPLDGEQVALEVEAVRISVPYRCPNGCCGWGETYDWDEKSDDKNILWYVGRMDIEGVLDDEGTQYVEGMADFLTDHHAKEEEIADLEAMFLSDGYEDYT